MSPGGSGNSSFKYPNFFWYSLTIFLCGFLLLEQEPTSRQTSRIAYLHRCEPQDSEPCRCLRWTTGARLPFYLPIIFTSRETKHFYWYRLKRGLRVFQLGRKICPEGRDKVMFTTVHIRAKRVIKIAGRSIGFVTRLLSVPHHMSLPSFNIMPQGVCSSSRYFSVFTPTCSNRPWNIEYLKGNGISLFWSRLEQIVFCQDL